MKASAVCGDAHENFYLTAVKATEYATHFQGIKHHTTGHSDREIIIVGTKPPTRRIKSVSFVFQRVLLSGGRLDGQGRRTLYQK
jgi:hypothetical protein